jgi:hypothetical protein
MEQFPYHKTRSIFYWEAKQFFSLEKTTDVVWCGFKAKNQFYYFLFLIIFFSFSLIN